MKIEILSTNLNQALTTVSRSIASRVQLPILSNILIKANKQGVELVATDLEIGFRVKVGARVIEEGDITVPAKAFVDLVATLGATTVTLETEEDSLNLSADGIRASLQTISADEYPSVPSLDQEPDLKIAAAKLVPALNRVVIASSKDDSRPVFTGMLWRFSSQALMLVSTDGYRLSQESLPAVKTKLSETGGDLIIPGRALVELSRVVGKDASEDVAFKIDQQQQQVILKYGEVELVSRLLGGEFPAFEQIIPKDRLVTVKLNREELVEAVRRASIFARDAANIVRLRVLETGVVVSATSSQLGSNETTIDAQVDGEGVEMAFNGRYLLDYLSVAPEDEIVFESGGGLKPGLFKSTKFDYLHIIMPVRVQS
jgi:DNA polymerase-3 subunit beta